MKQLQPYCFKEKILEDTSSRNEQKSYICRIIDHYCSKVSSCAIYYKNLFQCSYNDMLHKPQQSVADPRGLLPTSTSLRYEKRACAPLIMFTNPLSIYLTIFVLINEMHEILLPLHLPSTVTRYFANCTYLLQLLDITLTPVTLHSYQSIVAEILSFLSLHMQLT